MCACAYVCIYMFNRTIGQVSRMFANGPRDWGSIPG